MYLLGRRVNNLIKKSLSRFEWLDLVSKITFVRLSQAVFKVRYGHVSVDKDRVIFEVFNGRNVSDSPLALFKELYERRPELNFVWVLDSPNNQNLEWIKSHTNTTVVYYGTNEYYREYARCHYWIVNCRLPFKIVKKSTQKYIQCWHGTPLKKLGHDITVERYSLSSSKGLCYSYNVDSSRYDYFISPSPYATSKFCSSFNIEKDKIIELGYPRNDILAKGSEVDRDFFLKKKLGLPLDKTIVLYAPTWRDNQKVKEATYRFSNSLDCEDFLNNFDSNYIFLFRGHYFVDSLMVSNSFIDVSHINDINDLLLVTDILITDFSSVFFDFSILKRPVLFYMPDRESYENDVRGFYLDVDKDLPGKVIDDMEVLSRAIKNCKPSSDLESFNLCFNPFEDGHSSLRVLKKIGLINE
ncbi:Teichoic acid biosynthesis protein F [Vibrio chagasii]|nr:Teichoic acid biosynthesis protein F [Vibrio chagasii]